MTDPTEICRLNDDGTITVFRHEPDDVVALAQILFAVRQRLQDAEEQFDLLAQENVRLRRELRQ